MSNISETLCLSICSKRYGYRGIVDLTVANATNIKERRKFYA